MRRRTKYPKSHSQQVEQLILEALEPNKSIIVNRRLIDTIGGFQALILSVYIDLYARRKDKNSKWFVCTHKHLEETLSLSNRVIRRYKRELVERGLLILKFNGSPAKEWVKINFTEITNLVSSALTKPSSQALTKPSSQQVVVEPGSTTVKPLLNVSPNETVNPEPGDATIRYNTRYNNTISGVRADHGEKHLVLSKKLSQAIQKVKNIKHPKNQLKAWARDFRKLERDNGVDIERMEKALDWYGENIGREFVPVIESGGAFRTKFTRLEMAIERDRTSPQKPPEVFHYGETWYLHSDGKYRNDEGRLLT